MMKKNVIIRSGSLRMGGLERVLIEVLQNIDKKKYNLTLVIDDDCGEDNIFEKDIPKEISYYFLKSQKLIEKTNYYKLRRKNILYKLMYNIYMNIETYIKSKNIKKLIEKLGKIDVFIDYDAGATKYIENIEADKKVVWIHNSIPNLKKSESKIKRFGKRLEKYDKIVAICDEMKEELIDIYPNLKDKILRIYNPFNFSRVLNLKDDLSELNEKDRNLLKEDYCIAISRLDTVQKDYKTLLKAFQILKSKGIDKKLYIVGDGPSKEEIKNMIKEYNLIEEVKLLGRFKNPYVWLNNADFFIHSSKYEGFGLVLIEAAILDKLIISSNCPVGPTEILENGKSGILFNVGDSQELAEKIEKVLNDKNLRNRYILSMKERREDFKKENVLKEYEKLIDEI
ncbi:glycosyltransferase [Fusobacterium sp.]|uniref:glycosyltransferase n=2 Tax=Fusobacterium sp. TaxID=68766 RepID=UPI0025E8F66C|nr:glycosyltransferase [Fusobacterium sp.]MDY3060642.1 glycosyltransferase [Fusobacterium sp.]MEE1476655.1 glycosyltransferase [Fusobacterium sp.]